MKRQATVKVVILNWNGEKMLARFLPSVVANTPREIEIVVADNGSTDGSVEMLRRDFPSVKPVLLDRNYGFAEGYDRAVAMLPPCDHYILLNSDVETPAGWSEPLVEMLSERDDVAAVAPKLLSADDHSRFEYAGASGGFIDVLGYPFCRGRILGTVEQDMGQYDDAREVFWATGACFACRADVFRDLGGFDASFFAHQEEIDLCWRMQAAGWKVMVEPRSAVFHLGAGTLAPSPQKLYYNYRNNLVMLRKNLPAGIMRTVIGVRIVLNLMSAAVYLLRGERANFDAVVRAHRDFRKMKRVRDSATTSDKATPDPKPSAAKASRVASQDPASRYANRRTSTVKPAGVYRGSILLAYLLGKRRFDRLNLP